VEPRVHVQPEAALFERKVPSFVGVGMLRRVPVHSRLDQAAVTSLSVETHFVTLAHAPLAVWSPALLLFPSVRTK